MTPTSKFLFTFGIWGLALLGTQLESQAASWWSSSAFSFGNLTQFSRSVQVDEYGSVNTIEWNPYLSYSYQFSDLFLPNLSLIPEAGLVWPTKGPEDSMTKYVSFLRTDLGYLFSQPVLSSLRMSLGLGLFITHIRGKGGIAYRRNGLGTSAFFLPSRQSTAFNITGDVGLEYFFTHQFSFKGRLHVFSPFKSLSRQYSYTLALTYYVSDLFPLAKEKK